MKLLRPADVPPSGATQVFRRSPARAIAAYALGGAVTAVLAWAAWRGGNWLLGYLAAVLGLVLVLAQGAVRARLGPGNWLVRAGPAGMHVHLRSHLNANFPSDDLTVAFIAWSEIRSARPVRERRTVAYRDAGHRAERQVLEWRRLVELELGCDAGPLAQALADEVSRKAPREKRWYGSASTTYRHYPVRLVGPTTLEIEWRVRPGASAFLAHAGRFVRVLSAESRDVDLRDAAGLDRAEQERRIATLAQTGQEMAAIAQARAAFDLDLAGARELVQRLRQARP